MTALETLRAELERAAAELPEGELAELVGLLAAVQARLVARITTPNRVPADSAPAELVTAEVVAKRFSLAVSSVHELARLGRLPCHMFGRYRRFNLAEIAEVAHKYKTGPVGPVKKPSNGGGFSTPVTTRSPRGRRASKAVSLESAPGAARG
jgi:hypothetical protein